MTNTALEISTAILALLRRDASVRGTAERLAVSEAQVREWQDLFTVAGVLALSESLGYASPDSRRSHLTAFLTTTSQIFPTLPPTTVNPTTSHPSTSHAPTSLAPTTNMPMTSEMP